MIGERIFDWAKRTPDRTAMIHNGERVSYRSLARLVGTARSYFARQGCIGPGSAVLAVQNLRDFWIYSLALRSLGQTTAAVWAAAMVNELGLPDVRCVVTSPSESWAGLDALCAARGLALLSPSLDGEPWPAPKAPHPPGGHILLTSGTTGTFKMLVMSPAVDAVFLPAVVDAIGLNAGTVMSVFDFPPWTGVGYKWAAATWVAGGAVLVEQGREPHRALLRPGVTHAMVVPAMLDDILAQPENAFPCNETLQLFVTGGTPTRSQVERAKVRIAPRVFNYLASTEAGGIAKTPLDTPEDHRWHRLVAGRVLETVDEFDRPVPPGETGRLRIATAGGPTGYLNNEAATREFFRDGFFYPGDLAVIRADGRMALHGRLTDVVNVRGHKISTAPYEERLCDILGVTGVCIFSDPNDAGEEVIHLAIETSKPIEEGRLNSVVAQECRGFGPVHVHTVTALPRNRMSKVLRQAVRDQVLGGRQR